MALTHDEKLELLKSLPDELAGDEFYAPPAATRGREVIRWEDNLPLDVFRAHKGLGAAILAVFEHTDVDGPTGETDTKTTDSVRNAIVGRLSKVYPSESWTTYVHDGMVWLKFNGEKVARKVKASE